MGHRANIDEPPTGLPSAMNPSGTATRLRLQAFPLLANPGRLQLLCDRWFNDYIPPEVAHFRATLPVVMCGVVHYPEMGGELPWRTGTMSQNEVYFLLPLARYRRVRGRWQFVEFGATTPYIFVDNAESAIAGRERFGMPKQPAVFTTETEGLPWPVGVQPYLSIQAWNPSPSGHQLQPLLEIVRSSDSRPNLAFGEKGRAMPRMPVAAPSTVIWLTQVVEQMGGPAGMAAGSMRMLQMLVSALRGESPITLFSLRQFADPEFGRAARYQDLISFRMRVVASHGSGLLSPIASGTRFSLLAHKSGIRPIVERLGLRVTRQETSRGRGTIEVLDAIVPFYAQGDVDLAAAKTLCSRRADRGWVDEQGRRLTPDGGGRARYNQYLGPGSAGFMEPQAAAPSDFKFMMLPARAEALQAFVAQALDEGCGLEVEPITLQGYGAVRVAIYHSRRRPGAEQEGLIWQDGSYMSLSIPVTFLHRGNRRTALLGIRDFTNNGFLVQAIRELTASPTALASFRGGDGAWFGTTQRFSTLLAVSAQAIDRTAAGARLSDAPVLDVLAVGRSAGLPPPVPAETLTALRSELSPLVESILPILTVGGVPAADNHQRLIARRVMLTEFTKVRRDETAGAGLPAQMDHLVRLHESETYPEFCRLGLVDLRREDHPLGLELREGITGRTLLVHCAGYGEAAYNILERKFEVLWEGW